MLLAKRPDLSEVRAIYTSDLKRSHQTAAPLSERISIPIVTSPLLREGNWAHHHRDSEYPPLPFDGPFEDKETLTKRAVRSMTDIAKSQQCSPILVIAHATFVRCFLYEMFPNRALEYQGIRTAINHLRHSDGVWQLMTLNDDAHLRDSFQENTSLDSG